MCGCGGSTLGAGAVSCASLMVEVAEPEFGRCEDVVWGFDRRAQTIGHNIGDTSFFLGHPEHVALSAGRQEKLNDIKKRVKMARRKRKEW